MKKRILIINLPKLSASSSSKSEVQSLKVKRQVRKIVYDHDNPPPPIIRESCSKNEINKFPIQTIHDKIKAKLKFECEVKELEQELEYLQKKLEGALTIADRRTYDDKKLDIERKIEKKSANMIKYIRESKPYITSFENEKTSETLNNYLQFAQNYTDVEVIFLDVKGDQCKYCDYILDNVYVSSEGARECPKCWAQDYGKALLSKDTTPSTNVVLNQAIINCDKRNDDNIMRIFRYFACIQGAEDIPYLLYDKLDQHFVQNEGAHPGSYYRALPANDEGYTGDTNHGMLFEGLRKTKLTDYFKYANLIGHLYWGWKKPQIAHLEEDFRNIYNDLINAYYQLDNIDRISKPHNQFMLFNILRLLSCEFPKSHFKLPTTSKSRAENETIYKMMCDRCKHNPRIRYIRTF